MIHALIIEMVIRVVDPALVSLIIKYGLKLFGIVVLDIVFKNTI